ncbi:MAG: hypothetical protein IH936_14735, partial [Acidobacteria bacterium]|nr:hypothetical protein [Acidobacteriota bacterium]
MWFSFTNNFYNLNADYHAAIANTSVFNTKAEKLEPKVLGLVESYVGLDENLTLAVKERNLDDLNALFERYPQLRASSNAKPVLDEYIKLIGDIARGRRPDVRLRQSGSERFRDRRDLSLE